MSSAEPLVLAIESSCDETAAAVVRGPQILSNIVASQASAHAPFGGVVPEIASREHVAAVSGVCEQALRGAKVQPQALDAVAVTHGPGLVGALLVGVSMGRGIALASQRPLWGIHHHEGHLVSARIQAQSPMRQDLEVLPHLALLVSGGHTLLLDVQGLGRYRILGQTRDDAVGEAFDKAAKYLGLGYPGGPLVDRLAEQGDPNAVAFPRAMLDQPNLDLSFSGLKTAMSVHLDKHGQPNSRDALADLCASFQEAIAVTLEKKTERALKKTGHKRLHLVGGAGANSRIRALMASMCARHQVTLCAAPLRYCGDNAAMIALAAAMRIKAGQSHAVNVQSYIDLETLHQGGVQ